MVIGIVNRTNIPVSGAILQYSALINGKPRQGQSDTGAIAQGRSIRIHTGWQINETDYVERLNIQVVGVCL